MVERKVTPPSAWCSTSSPFSISHKTHKIDSKGDLCPVHLSLDLEYYNLKIEKLECSVPATPGTPFQPLPTPPLTPLSPKSSSSQVSFKKRSFRSLWSKMSFNSTSSRTSTSGYSSNYSISPSVSSVELIPLSAIQERIRLSDYDPKSLKLSSESIKALRPLTGGMSKKILANKHKVLEVLFGKEFNLKSYTFVVTGVVESIRQKEQLGGVIHDWVILAEKLRSEDLSMGYFEKLDLWYRKQHELIIQKNTDYHRLKIWKQFLHRNRHRITTQSLQVDYGYVEQLVRRQYPTFCSGTVKKSEFDLIARYFVHSTGSVSKIFDQFFCPGEDNLFQLLDVAPNDELNAHPILGEFVDLFKNYFYYVGKKGRNFPEISSELDGSAVFTKAVIRKFAERLQEQQQTMDRLVSEMWLNSYYLLDYLFSSDNSIWSPETIELRPEIMNRPLSHYYINSSHNTYLTGDQYSSQSSVETYARALRQGCRCVEIDVWNGPASKPIVKHGRTLTTAVKLKDVLLTIKAHAFASSPYPVIISIENHCNLRQQKNMAKYFRKIFGKSLLTNPLEGRNSFNGVNELPSPEQLKHKIILKGRKLPFSEKRSSLASDSCNERVRADGDNLTSTAPQHPTSLGPKISVPSATSNSAHSDANQCDCLMTGELWKSTEDGKWVPCIFVLTNKRLFYIERRDDEKDTIAPGQLPSYLQHRDLRLRHQSVSSIDSIQDLHNDQLWYHGKMAGGRQAASALLEHHAINGSFLVRESDSNLTGSGYTLSFYYKDPQTPDDEQGAINHCHIYSKKSSDDEAYFLRKIPKEEEMFPSLFELIEYYKKNSLVTNRCNLDHLGDPAPPSVSHETQEWFYKHMDRATAEKILEKLPINGAFLGRYKKDDIGEVVISFRFENVIKHCHVIRDGRYLIVANMKFIKLETLVDHYSRYAFYKDIRLSHPVGKELYAQSQQSDCVQRVYACPEYINSTVKTVKGRVRAIQSHPTTDPDLLCFKKGDIIVNVIKEPDGWWLGTREGADGPDALLPKQFPPSFVEDIEELEECPFGDYIGKGVWKLGRGAKVKLCTDKAGKEAGIKHYLSFKDLDGTKRKLGASCSKRRTNEWVDMINHVVANDTDGEKTLAKIIAAEKYNIEVELSDLIVYCCSMDKKLCPNDYGCPWEKERVNGFLTKSLDEFSGDKLFRTRATFFVWYHQYALTRIYPIGFRLNSSNFSPVRFWNVGSQMVALNFQTPDKAMQWNRGKFKQNGNSGYVLKPEFMIPGNKVPEDTAIIFDPTLQSGEPGWGKGAAVTIQIISARHLEKQGSCQVTPIVELEVVGVDADCRKVKTSWQESGLNPCWNETIHLNLHCPELALIQFRVCDLDTFSDTVLLGEATVPFPCIRTGYRSIQLQNAYGLPLFSTLLVHISVKERDSLSDSPSPCSN